MWFAWKATSARSDRSQVSFWHFRYLSDWPFFTFRCVKMTWLLWCKIDIFKKSHFTVFPHPPSGPGAHRGRREAGMCAFSVGINMSGRPGGLRQRWPRYSRSRPGLSSVIGAAYHAALRAYFWRDHRSVHRVYLTVLTQEISVDFSKLSALIPPKLSAVSNRF